MGDDTSWGGPLFTIEQTKPTTPPQVVVVNPTQISPSSSPISHRGSNLWKIILLLIAIASIFVIVYFYGPINAVEHREDLLNWIHKWIGNTLSPAPSLTPVDCQVKWGNWSNCSALCGTNGTVTRTATIITNPSNGGTACPSLVQTQPCNPLPPTCDTTCCNNQGLQISGSVDPTCASCYSPSSPSPSPSSPANCALCPAKDCNHTCSCNLNFSGGSCQVSSPAPVNTSATFYHVPGW